METQFCKFVVSGLVQGVTYRASTQKKAASIGLRGWVRNLPSGEVEVYCQGKIEQIEELMSWCRRGPSLARVKNLKRIEEGVETGSIFESFEIRL